MLLRVQAWLSSGIVSFIFSATRLMSRMSAVENGVISENCCRGNLPASKMAATMPMSEMSVRSASLSAPSLATVPP